MTIFKRFSIFCAKILAKESQHIADELKYETVNKINDGIDKVFTFAKGQTCSNSDKAHFYVYANKTTITDVICIKCNHKTTIRKILAEKERNHSNVQ